MDIQYETCIKILESVKNSINNCPTAFFEPYWVQYELRHVDQSIELIHNCLNVIDYINQNLSFEFENIAYLLTQSATCVHKVVYETAEFMLENQEALFEATQELPDGDEKKKPIRAYLNNVLIQVEALSGLFSMMSIPLSYVSGIIQYKKKELDDFILDLDTNLAEYCTDELMDNLLSGDEEIIKRTIQSGAVNKFYNRLTEIMSRHSTKLVDFNTTKICNKWLMTLDTIIEEKPEYDENYKPFDDILADKAEKF